MHSGWEARIARARRLAEPHQAATELLRFYAALAEWQGNQVRSWRGSGTGDVGSGTGDPGLGAAIESAVDAIPAFLSWLSRERTAPAPLSAAAVEMRDIEGTDWRRRTTAYLDACGQPHIERLAHHESPILNPEPPLPTPHSMVHFVLHAVLQPFAEQAAAARPASRTSSPEPRVPSPEPQSPISPAIPQSPIPNAAMPPGCPHCRALPVLAVLREEGHGAKRALLCGLCLTEWNYPRVACPSCGEQAFEALPVYTAEQIPHVRIDACDRCKTYLKTIDLTKDGHAVPVVDDLASLSLDLWARERGYQRLRAGLLGA